MEDLQDGDRFYYLSRTAGLNLLTQLEGNSFAELIMRNTDAEGLPADSFSYPAMVFDVDAIDNDARTGAGRPATAGLERGDRADPDAALGHDPVRRPRARGLQRHRRQRTGSGPARVTTPSAATTATTGCEGGDGVDNLIGGLGDDLLTDLNGDDTLKGGDGDDTLSSGQGFGGDLNQGGRGNDFIIGGNDITETFAGPGNDFVFAGDAEDTVFGDDGDDWIETGVARSPSRRATTVPRSRTTRTSQVTTSSTVTAVSRTTTPRVATTSCSPGPASSGPRACCGFDWVTHQGDPEPADSDMDFTGAAAAGGGDQHGPVRPGRGAVRATVRRHPPWRRPDGRPTSARAPAHRGRDRPDHGLDPACCGPSGHRTYNGGNIIIGGGGARPIEGRGGDDVIDGDA